MTILVAGMLSIGAVTLPQLATSFVVPSFHHHASTHWLTPQQSTATTRRSSLLHLHPDLFGGSTSSSKKNIKLPLLDILDSEDYADRVVVPLPCMSLPDELTTPFLYGMELDRPVFRLLMEKALETENRSYGHVVYKACDDSLVGAVGCAAQVLIHAPSKNELPTSQESNENQKKDPSETIAMTTVCRGSFRFVVKEVVQTFPYPIAVVDELVDDEPTSTAAVTSQTENDENDNDDYYSDLEPPELIKRIILGLQSLVKQQLDDTSNLTLLEKTILQDSGQYASDASNHAEEMAAVLDVFVSSLVDTCPMPLERYYAVGIMAAEIANVDNNLRRQVLTTTNGLERLRFLLEFIQERVGMAQARKAANAITNDLDQEEGDLQVGIPELPPWANQIKKGTKLEYYWNEEYGWCGGTVVDEPFKVVDELLVTVQFEDGEVHKLPFRGDEKVRWRPAQ